MDKRWLLTNLVTLFLAFSQLTSSEKTECDERCQDYLAECFALPYSETGDIAECKQERYKTYCPMTCGVCQKCDTARLVEGLAARVTTLEKRPVEQEFSKKMKQLKPHIAFSGKTNCERCVPGRLFDGIWDTMGWVGTTGRFITVNEDGERWVELYLSDVYQITKIRILNSHWIDKGLRGTGVSVCKNESKLVGNCEGFATIEHTPAGGWTELTPLFGEERSLEGNIVRIEQYKPGHLELTEVLVFGNEINF